MLHPSKFFELCDIRTGMDVFEIYDQELKASLMNTHPKNFINVKLTHPIYSVTVGYNTEKGNYKQADKIMILDCPVDDNDYSDMWADIFVRDYEQDHEGSIYDIHILNVNYLGDAILRIG